MNKLVLADREHPGVTTLTLNRPEKRNALNIAMMEQIADEMAKSCRDPSQRVVLIRGEGPVFCSGLDLLEAKDAIKEDQSARMVAKMLEAVYTCPLITIATVQGVALAGGAGLMSACDFVVAADRTQIGYPETRVGLVAALVMILLVRELHPKHIRELLLLGEIIQADKALEMGLINRIVPEREMMDTALELARLTMKGAPEATKQTKKLLQELYPIYFSDDVEKALEYHHQARHSKEAQEGIAAFLEKREPVWE